MNSVSSSLATDMEMTSLFAQTITHATQFMKADRATLFVIEEAKEEESGKQLWGMITHGETPREEIRIPLTTGVAGHAARTGEVVNVENAYLDNRFNASVDFQGGYVTKAILCAPILDFKGKIVGVLEVINKKDGGVFGKKDEELLQMMNVKIGQAITKCTKWNGEVVRHNAELLAAVSRKEKLEKEVAEEKAIFATVLAIKNAEIEQERQKEKGLESEVRSCGEKSELN